MKPTLKFGDGAVFDRELRRRVDQYFSERRLEKRDSPRMYRKTAAVLLWCLTSYILLLCAAGTWWLGLTLAISLGLSMTAIAFNVQHDGSHQAYSRSKRVNGLMTFSLDLLGGSSYLWALKHNTVHHSFTNVSGHDDDINLGALARLTPDQPHRWYHRFQPYYLWILYGFLTVKWQFLDDYRDAIIGQSGGRPCARPRGKDLAVFLLGKTLFVTLAVVIPLTLHPLATVVAAYAVASFVQGVVLSVVFQLAHCVEEASFPLPEHQTSRMKNSWAVHQIETTVDFSRDSRFVSWYCGGLNFQIEHHLFPRICHVHYPALAPIVERTCQEFGVEYRCHRSLLAGVRSHFRWLRRMGSGAAA